MKLADILGIASEGRTVRVLRDDNECELAVHNDEESVPDFLRDAHVAGLSASADEIIVYVNGEMEM